MRNKKTKYSNSFNVQKLWLKMTSIKRYPEEAGYYHCTPNEPWDSDYLIESNARLAELGLADIMEHCVINDENAILFKGPHAAQYLAVHNECQRSLGQLFEKRNRPGLSGWKFIYNLQK